MKLTEMMSSDFFNKILNQLKSSLRLLLIPYLIVLITLFSVWVISWQYNILIDNFFREPAAILKFNPFLGVMSNLGVLLWAFTAAICLFVAVLLIKRGSKKIGLYLLYSATLTFVLLVDDFFLLHEHIFPRYLNVPEKVFYLAYILAMLFFFLLFARIILQTDYLILLIACGFLALSMLSDLVLRQTGIAVLVEDGFKLFGIVTWLIYFTRTCYQQTVPLLKQ
ncbi:hypothetical protein [Nitrosomonas supralitoralis]|uniref:Uncharacterized protein n=1 Tax=Nitrosomonas supralitoralis TaxID=2116706 RepID=A0A2P7NZM3_9PROT|nr:hypothetical protein [Nitrosomonas supralitoralis]PSJ18897.1 hypothetical protein C7H79_00200 [Nitrosomonas supralitoralis]